MSQYAKISGSGSYLPKKILTNRDLEKMVDTSDEWIVKRSGISQRHIAADDETASTMAEIAANHALDMAGIKADDIDLVIVATATPDRIFPSTACLLQASMGIPECPAFDISAACAGFIYGVHIANQFIRVGTTKNALVVGSEVYSRIIDWKDRTTCVLFGDGAGAFVLTGSDKPGIFSTDIRADGNFKDALYVPHQMMSNQDKNETPYLKMHGSEVFRFAVRTLEQAVVDALEKNNLKKSELDWLVPHQANLRIIQALAKKLDMPMEKVVATLDKHANTSSASIPLAFDEAVRDGRIKRGDKVLMEGFGGGFTWGSALLEF